MIIKLLLLFCNLCNAIYNINYGYTGVFLSGAAYCNKNRYLNMKLIGPVSGFIITDIIYDSSTDLQGYIGYLDNLQTIHIVIRGSASFLNFFDDFKILRIPYETWPECNCTVHNGFYKMTRRIKNDVIEKINVIRKNKPNYTIIINGHSLGSAIADLLSMELAKENIESMVYGYGKPRIGDIKYAKFYNTKIKEHYRHTHNKDIVPHLPPNNKFDYYHSCQEIFEDMNGKLKICSSDDCEDKSCGEQYKLFETNIYDHKYYLGHKLECLE